MLKAIKRNPGNSGYQALLAKYLYTLGESAKSEEFLKDAYETAPTHALLLDFYIQYFIAQDMLDDKVLEYAGQLHSVHPANGHGLYVLSIADIDAGNSSIAVKRHEEAYPQFATGADYIFTRHSIDNAIYFAWLLLEDGQKQRANHLLDQAEIYIQTIPRACYGGSWGLEVMIYALRGMKDHALEALQRTVDEGWRRSWRRKLQHRILDPIRDDAKFKSIEAQLEADMVIQLKNIRDMEANGELESFIE